MILKLSPMACAPAAQAVAVALFVATVPLAESKKERRVDPMGETVLFAKSMGVSFGD